LTAGSTPLRPLAADVPSDSGRLTAGSTPLRPLAADVPARGWHHTRIACREAATRRHDRVGQEMITDCGRDAGTATVIGGAG
jgi:hypothetical protein